MRLVVTVLLPVSVSTLLQSPSPATSIHASDNEVPLPGPSHDIQQAPDIQPVASPPEVPPGELSNTVQPPERSSRFKRWLQTRINKRNVEKPNRLPGTHPGLPGPYQPPTRANEGLSIFAEGQRQKVNALARRLDVPSLTHDSSELSQNLLQDQRFVIPLVPSQPLIALGSPNHR